MGLDGNGSMDRLDPLVPLSCDSSPSSQDLGPLRHRLRRRLLGCFACWSTDEQPSNGVPPYSTRNEVKYFFSTGIALGLSSLMNFGIPPLVAMIFAGHTQDSSRLQASLGYGRVWYNCTALMPMVAMFSYAQNVIPGCIGAGREDRIPRYLQRSVFLSFSMMIPSYALQLAAGSIMQTFGVPTEHAQDVGVYCRIMIISSMISLLNSHLEMAFIILGYAKCATLNSFITGLGVDMTCTYCFIFLWGWGIEGAAFGRIAVQLCRFLIWLALMYFFRLFRKICVVTPGGESFLPKIEVRMFVDLAIPMVLRNFAGWFIFELQLMGMANIRGISNDALAAGAIWVQFESATAAAQTGWIQSTSIRSLALLGKQDPGARKSFIIFSKLSALAVAISSVIFLMVQSSLCSLVSNDEAVRQWLSKILWVIVIHTQTRISNLGSAFLFIPLGQGMLSVKLVFFAFYVVATPISGFVALTDYVTTDVSIKMVACVGASSIAQAIQVVYSFWYLLRLDWREAALIISLRANTDKQEAVLEPAAELAIPDS